MSQLLTMAFLAHLIVSDGTISQDEVDCLASLFPDMDEKEAAVVEAILSDTPDKMPSGEVITEIRNLSPETRFRCLELAIQIAYTDGFFDINEQHLIDQAVKTWEINPEDFNRLKTSAHSKNLKAEVSQQSQSNAAQRVLKATTVNLLKSIGNLTKGSIADKLDKISTRMLLAGPEYADAVAACAKVAKHDFSFAEGHLKKTGNSLKSLTKEVDAALQKLVQDQDQEAQQLVEALRGLQNDLQEDILAGIEKSYSALNLKERAMGYFTITFIGKTKAGKSTLHTVITGEGQEQIGVGKQRTTRYNRSYVWKGLRIMDTPGIGAPQEGGDLDTAYALQAIDESDVICFVVSNDSQQTTELDFLKGIRDRNKPVVVLLNVKENLTDPARLKRFLKDPERWATRTDSRSLRGHVERIERYARERFTGSRIEVIPVHLLAARLAAQEADSEIAAQLKKGSRLKPFLDFLRVSVIEQGLLRRSQTLLDGTHFDLMATTARLRDRTEFLGEAAIRFKKKGKEIAPQMNKAYQQQKKELEEGIKQIYAPLKEELWEFASEHHGQSESDIKDAWERHCVEFELEKKLKEILGRCVEGYINEAQSYIDEVVGDFALLSEDHATLNFSARSTFSFGDVFGFIGKVLQIGSAIAFCIPGLQVIAIAASLVGGVIKWIGGLFKSGEEKRREATQNLYDALLASVNRQEKEVTPKLIGQLTEVHQNVSGTLLSSLEILTQTVERIHGNVKTVLDKVESSCKELEKAFAYRALNFARHGNNAPQVLELSTIVDTQRTLGKQFTIISNQTLSEKARQQLSLALGEEIVLKSEKEAANNDRTPAIAMGN